MANMLNNCFVKVADRDTNNIPKSRKSPLECLDNKNPHSFFIFPAAPCEISDIVDLFESGKSTGPNSIPLKFDISITSYFFPPVPYHEWIMSVRYFYKKNAASQGHPFIQEGLLHDCFIL